MSSITIFPEECWSIAEWYFLWQAAGFIHGRWWRGSTEEPQPSPGRSGCRLLELTGSFIYFIHLQPPTIILLVLSRIRNPEYGCGVGADICCEAPDPGSCLYICTEWRHTLLYFTTTTKLWCRVAASVLICGAQWWRHHLPVFHPGCGGDGGGDTHAVVTHIIISTADVSPVSAVTTGPLKQSHPC